MLVATNEVAVGPARVRTTFGLERVVRASVVERVGLAFDSRFAAAMPAGPPRGTLYLVVSGRVVTPTATCDAPVALALLDGELERVVDRSRGFRVDGPRADTVELLFHREGALAPRGLAAGPVALPPACWSAAAAVVARRDAASFGALLAALADTGAIARDLGAPVGDAELGRFARIWPVFEALYGEHTGATSLKLIAGRLGMSVRQVTRDADDLAATFGLPGGYRDTLRALRLRLATLLLSAPASIADVAARAGYGSAIAMARAFRDAGLPAPRAVQAAITSAA
jgi:AraC-like DNA-binding protein